MDTLRHSFKESKFNLGAFVEFKTFLTLWATVPSSKNLVCRAFQIAENCLTNRMQNIEIKKNNSARLVTHTTIFTRKKLLHA